MATLRPADSVNSWSFCETAWQSTHWTSAWHANQIDFAALNNDRFRGSANSPRRPTAKRQGSCVVLSWKCPWRYYCPSRCAVVCFGLAVASLPSAFLTEMRDAFFQRAGNCWRKPFETEMPTLPCQKYRKYEGEDLPGRVQLYMGVCASLNVCSSACCTAEATFELAFDAGRVYRDKVPYWLGLVYPSLHKHPVSCVR